MEISYTVDYDKHRRTLSYYLKSSKIAVRTVETTILFKLWVICFILVIPLILLTKNYGFCLSVFVYYFLVLLFLVFSKMIAVRLLLWGNRKELEKTDNSQVSIELNENTISFESKRGLVQYNWDFINEVEKSEQYLLFDVTPPRLIPRYAFQTNGTSE